MIFEILLALIAQDASPSAGTTPLSGPDTTQARRFSRGDRSGPRQPAAFYEAEGVLRAVDPDPEAWLSESLDLLEPYRSQQLSSLVARLHRPDDVVRQPDRSLHIWREQASVASEEQTGGAMPGQGFRTVSYVVHCTLVIEADAEGLITRFGLSGEGAACDRILRWLR